jgi:hypothetical protein
MEEKRGFKQTNESSGAEMLAEICRLILLLIWKMTKKFLRFTLNSLQKIGRYIGVFFNISAKRTALLTKLTGNVINRGSRIFIIIIYRSKKQIKDFWYDNNTQEKIRTIRSNIKSFGFFIWHCIKLAGKASIHFLKAACVFIKQTAINTKPFIIAGWNLFIKSCVEFGLWLRECWRNAKKSHKRRVVAFKRFRKNKGFKGLLIDTGNYLRNTLNEYMDEEEASSETSSNIDDDIYEEDLEDGNKAKVIGKKLFSSVKNIVDVND